MAYKKGHKGYWKGKHRSIETKERVGEFFRGKTYEQIMGVQKAKKVKELRKNKLIGDKNPFWQGGKTKNLKYDLKKFNNKFKNLIRKRDNQVCMNCGVHREKLIRALDIHHIDYDELNTIKENCISLCRKCHGLTQINREYWINLFQNKLKTLYGYKYPIIKEIIYV